jgi:hypothetical protein
MARVLAILSHPAAALLAGLYLMCISFAWTFFGMMPAPVVIGSLLWIGGGIVIVTGKKLLDRAENT